MLRSNTVSISLRNKITLLICSMTLMACLLIGGFAYYRTTQITLNTAVQGLAGETRLMAMRFGNSYNEMKRDVFVVAHTPPINGLIRSLGNDGVDPLDGSTTELWRTRLETIFASIMESKKYYTQMRFIGLHDGGRELVRMNRTEGGLAAVPQDKLQQKAHERYFQEGKKLPKDRVFFSEVTYNREKGQVDPKLIPTMRTITPVYNGDKPFGMVVINADYSLLLRQTFKDIESTKNTFVTNHAGDYMEYKGSDILPEFELHSNYSTPPPEFIKHISEAKTDEASFSQDNQVAYFVRLNIDPNNPDSFLGIVLRVNRDELLEETYATQRQMLTLSILITLCSLIIAAWVARRLTARLNQMTNTISQADSYQQALELPVEGNDEIADLARAFSTMTQHLKQNEEETRAILDNVVDGIITIDESGKIHEFNPACEQIFGYNAKDIKNKSVSLLLADTDPTLSSDTSLGSLDTPSVSAYTGTSKEVTGLRKDGERFPMEFSVSDTRIKDGGLYTGVIRDITERKQMEIMKNEFISTVNHELRSPLTSIQGSLGLLKLKLKDKLDAKGQHLLELSYDNCKRLTHLVNDILDMEKIAAGKMEYAIETVEMNSLVRDIIERHQSYADKHHVSFNFLPETKNVFGKVDPNRFNQALVNLISNACKFSPEGQEVFIRVVLESTNQIRVSVQDHGPGIPKAFRGKIFEKFAQADSSSTRARSGTGLGLNITKSIIEAFGGTVSFDTEEGKGTTFHFLLPAFFPNTQERLSHDNKPETHTIRGR